MHELRLQARRVLGKLFRFHPSVCSIVCLAKHKIDHRRRERDGYRRHGFGSLRFKPVVYVAHSKISNEPLTGSNWTSIPCSIVKPTSPTAFSKLRQRQFERTIKIMSERAHVDIVFRCWQCWMFFFWKFSWTSRRRRLLERIPHELIKTRGVWWVLLIRCWAMNDRSMWW